MFSVGAEAKSKKAYYLAHRIAESKYNGGLPNVFEVTKKSNKLTFRGELYKSSSASAFRKGKSSIVKNKTFKVTSKCKYRYTDFKGVHKVSQKKLIKETNREYYEDATIEFKTNKSGNINYINLDVGSYRY